MCKDCECDNDLLCDCILLNPITEHYTIKVRLRLDETPLPPLCFPEEPDFVD